MTVDEALSLPVLSIKQPWASFVVGGIKTIELRTWSTPYRGWLWIHTGKTADEDALELLDATAEQFQLGGLLAVARLESCEEIETPAQWARLRTQHRAPGTFLRGIYGWRFSDTITLSKKISCPGERGLFYLRDAKREAVRAMLATDLEFADEMAAIAL